MQYDFDDAIYSAPTEIDMDYAMTIDEAMAMKAGLPIPKRVGIQRNLITGEIVDYNAGLVFNPTTGRVLQILQNGKRQIVPKSDNRYGWMVRGVDRLLNQPQQELTTETPTDGDGRFFGDSIYSRKRNRARPYGRDANMGYSPQFAQQNQSYSPDVMSRVGQGGVLENYGTVILPGAKPEWKLDTQGNIALDSNGNPIAKARWSNYPGDERPTTLIYQNQGGNVVPSISIPVPGQKNQLLPISQIDRTTMSPAQRRLLEDIPTPQYATNDQLSKWAVGKVKVGEDATISPLQNKGSSYQTNYRSTYVDARTGEVYNVTSDKTGKFNLIRPEISEEGYGFPLHKQTTNLTQEMIGINQGMKIGGNETITDIIREDPSIPGLDYFSEPVIAGLNPITGRPEVKYIHKGNLVNPQTGLPEKILPGEDYSQYAVLDKDGKPIPEGDFIRLWDRTMGTPKPPNLQLLGEASKDVFKPIPRSWVNDDANARDLFNYWQLNQESQGQNMVAYDLSRGGRRVAGIKKSPAFLPNPDYEEGKKYPVTYTDTDGVVRQIEVEGSPTLNRLQSKLELYYDNEGNLQYRINKEPYGNTGYASNDVTPAYQSLQDGDYLGNRLRFSQDGIIVNRPAPADYVTPEGIQNFTPASDFYSQGSQLARDLRTGKVIYDPNRDLQQAAKTEFWKLRDAPPSVPISAYRVNEYGTVLVDGDGYPLEAEGVTLPRSAQIVNTGTRSFSGIENAPRNPEDYPVAYPNRFDPNNKGITPDYEFPDGMSYEEADRLGLVQPVFTNTRKRALDDRHQIPVPNGVGFTRVLPFEDPRTQSALASQEIALQNAAQAKYKTPSIQRDYEIKPSRTAGIDSPQYAMFADLEGRPSDDAVRFWKENISGVIPQGVVDGAYVPITMNPRNEQGKPPKKDALMTAINGRTMLGKDIKFYGHAPLDLEYVMSHVDPRDMNRLLGEGLTEQQIRQKVLDNALANTQIELDGTMYSLTREATEPFFDATPTSKYYQASNNVAFRGANVNSPIVNDVLGEPSDDWIREQMTKGNLNFSPENWMSEGEKTTLKQRGVYADPSIEPRDIVDAIDVAQRKKNAIDAMISNQRQREYNPATNILSAADIQRIQEENANLDFYIQEAINNGDKKKAKILLTRKATNQRAISSTPQFVESVTTNAPLDSYLPSLSNSPDTNPQQILNWKLEPIPKAEWKTSSYNLSGLDPSQAVVENDAMFSPAIPRKPGMSLAEQSRHLREEIMRATIAQNQFYQVEDTPEITVTRQGKPWQLQGFLDTANSVLEMKTTDDSFQYKNNPDEIYSASVAGSFPMRDYLTPYEQTKALDIPYEAEVDGQERQFRLLPSHKTSQLFTPVPTSNMKDLSREPVPFPEEVITTSQVAPQGNVVAPLPSSSGSYPFRSGGNASYQTWDTPSTDGLGLLGFDGGSIPGDYIAPQEVLPLPDNPRNSIPSQVRNQPQQPRTSARTPVNPVVEPEVAMAGTKIPKWAIPASLGAAWLALASYQRRRKEQEERQRQSVNMG